MDDYSLKWMVHNGKTIDQWMMTGGTRHLWTPPHEQCSKSVLVDDDRGLYYPLYIGDCNNQGNPYEPTRIQWNERGSLNTAHMSLSWLFWDSLESRTTTINPFGDQLPCQRVHRIVGCQDRDKMSRVTSNRDSDTTIPSAKFNVLKLASKIQ